MTSISVITPVFNGEATLAETIESVRAQGPACAEYIVIDALSTDATPDIVSRYPDVVTRHVRESDRGLYDGMNKGIAMARGEVVAIINADDVLEPGALSRVSELFDKHPEAGFVCSDLTHMNASGTVVGLQPVRVDWLGGRRSPIGRDWRMSIAAPHPSVFVRRKVYEQIGLYDLSFPLAADHEFIARMINSGIKGIHSDVPLARFRVGGVSTVRMLECFKEDERIAVRYGVAAPFARLLRWRKSIWFKYQRAA